MAQARWRSYAWIAIPGLCSEPYYSVIVFTSSTKGSLVDETYYYNVEYRLK